MKLDVAGRCYLLVGGTAGMGLATAAVLAASGADLVLVGRDEDKATAAAASLASSHGVQAVGHAIDVSLGAEHAQRAVDATLEAFGRIDGIGITSGTSVEAHQSLEDASDADWLIAFNQILMATVRVVRAALPSMIDAGGGTIVTTSAYSIRNTTGARVPYTTLKAAIPVFTKDVARTYGHRGIRANCVCPGAIGTEQAKQRATEMGALAADVSYDEILKHGKIDVAAGRTGRPDEVGELIAFLLAPHATYLTGATINIDGGTNF